MPDPGKVTIICSSGDVYLSSFLKCADQNRDLLHARACWRISSSTCRHICCQTNPRCWQVDLLATSCWNKHTAVGVVYIPQKQNHTQRLQCVCSPRFWGHLCFIVLSFSTLYLLPLSLASTSEPQGQPPTWFSSSSAFLLSETFPWALCSAVIPVASTCMQMSHFMMELTPLTTYAERFNCYVGNVVTSLRKILHAALKFNISSKLVATVRAQQLWCNVVIRLSL